MRKFFRWTLVASVFCLISSAAFAQGRYEITPSLGYRAEGDFDVNDLDFLDDNFEVDDGESFGLTFDIPLGNVFSLELLANRQESQLIATGGLFNSPEVIADIDIDYYQVGLLAQFGSGQVQPFVAGSLGIAKIGLDLPRTIEEERPAATVGGGVKIYFSDHVGLRLEGRGYYVALDDDEESDRWDEADSLTQAEASIGLIIAF